MTLQPYRSLLELLDIYRVLRLGSDREKVAAWESLNNQNRQVIRSWLRMDGDPTA